MVAFYCRLFFGTPCTSGEPKGPPTLKIWITYIEAFMPHEASGDSSNHPPGIPLDPQGPSDTIKKVSTLPEKTGRPEVE